MAQVLSADLTDVDGDDFADLAGQHDEEMAPRGPVSLLAGPAVGLRV